MVAKGVRMWRGKGRRCGEWEGGVGRGRGRMVKEEQYYVSGITVSMEETT